VNGLPQRISVKSRTFKVGAAYVTYNDDDKFDWLAVVILPNNPKDARKVFVIPRTQADALARRDKPTAKTAKEPYYRIDEISKKFAKYENNFALKN